MADWLLVIVLLELVDWLGEPDTLVDCVGDCVGLGLWDNVCDCV